MQKNIFGVAACIVIALVFLQISCHNPAGSSVTGGPEPPYNPVPKTLIVFDNTYGICTAVVYDDYRRRDMDKVAEVPAGKCSEEFEWTPSTSTPFYFAYRVALKDVSGFTVDFVPEVGKDQKAVRIDAGTRTVIPIPVLDEAVSSQEQVLSPKSYLTVLNNSTYSFQLHRGYSMIRPDNSPDSGVVNSGERAPYTVNPGRSSDYRLLVGIDYKSFPDSPDRFEAGNFYSYQFTTNVSLDTEIPINLNNVDIKTYTVSFDGNGGSGIVPAAQNVRAASGITLPAGSGLTNGDRIFGGWGVEASGSGIVYSAGTMYTVTSDIILYAKWYPAGVLYTVTFNSAGGNATASQSMVSGTVAIRPADPYRAGYTFAGWYSDSSMQTLYDFATPVTESFTLYAAWSANRYTVTFNANGANGVAPAAVTVDYGSSITLPGAGGLSKPDETFRSWNTEDDGKGTAYLSGVQYTVTADVTLFAVWSNVPVYEMVFVPDGSFEMGKNLGTGGGSDVTPVHTVTLGGYYMGIYEVTQAQYEAVMWTTLEEQQALAGTNTSNYGKGDNYPMYYVSWYDALVFCNKLSMAEGLSPAYMINNSTDPAIWGSIPTSSNSSWDNVEIVSGSTGYRLPTEAQWEYAAKGGDGSTGNYTYAGSNDLDDVAWYSGNSASATHTIGTKAPNGLGLYDMSGNVSEWCQDWNGSYSSEAQTDPTGASSGSDRIVRGGSWYYFDQYASSVYRYNSYQYIRNNSQGFRLVRPTSYTITFNINGGTGAAPAVQTASLGSITLPNNNGFSKAGYVFNGWNTDPSGTGTNYSAGSSYTVTDNVTLYARWIELYTINFNLNGGTGTTPASQTAGSGSTITLPGGGGLSKSGYFFGGWNTNADGTGETYSAGSSYTVTGNVTLYARWTNTVAMTVSTTSEFTSALSEIRNSTDSYFTITVTADISLDPQDLTLAAYADKSITLRGNTPARTVSLSSQGSLFYVGTDVELVLEDIVLRGISNNNTPLVWVNAGGTLVLNSGEISGNTNTDNWSSNTGGGVYVYSNGTFTMNGGVIEGNSAGAGYGGGVYIYSSSFYFNGGRIRNNTATRGGGVYISSGSSSGSEFIMSEGIISGNSVTSSNANSTYSNAATTDTWRALLGAYGGGVFCNSLSDSFVKTGGIIYGNEVAGYDEDGIPLKNTAQSNNSGLGGGHAVFCDNGAGDSAPRRNTTIWETLYSDGSTLVGGTLEVMEGIGVTIAMWAYSSNWSWSGALRININGTNLSANAKPPIDGQGPFFYTFMVNSGDVVRLYWVNGNNRDNECMFAVYYSADPPNPGFNPYTNGWSPSKDPGGKVLLYNQYNPSGGGYFGNGTLMGSFTVP
jgi:uncharacterized repeat protein (TIGR02543 family)